MWRERGRITSFAVIVCRSIQTAYSRWWQREAPWKKGSDNDASAATTCGTCHCKKGTLRKKKVISGGAAVSCLIRPPCGRE